MTVDKAPKNNTNKHAAFEHVMSAQSSKSPLQLSRQSIRAKIHMKLTSSDSRCHDRPKQTRTSQQQKTIPVKADKNLTRAQTDHHTKQPSRQSRNRQNKFEIEHAPIDHVMNAQSTRPPLQLSRESIRRQKTIQTNKQHLSMS